MPLISRAVRILEKRVVKMTSQSTKRASGKVYLQVLGTSTMDTSASLFLFADSQRYIFNCGEGTQRIINEHKMKLTKINNIFFTRICWKYIGGLPGMAMTLRDNGKSDLGLHGPPHLSHFIHATRFFLHHEKVHFHCAEFTGGNEEKYEDENLTIWPIVLSVKGESLPVKKIPEAEESYKTSNSTENACLSGDNSEEPSKKRWKSDSKSCSVVCYICQLASLPGRFHPKKAKELGVPRGPLFGKLQSGITITLSDERKVHPEEVMEAPQPGPVFMIIDCPSEDFIPSLIANETLKKYWSGGASNPPVLICHLTPMELFQSNQQYQEWRKRFGNNVTHLLINKDVCGCPLVFQSQARIQCKLHCIAPDVFPLLHFSEIPDLQDIHNSRPNNCFAGECFLKFHLRPVTQQGFDWSEVPETFNEKNIIAETQQLLEKNTSKGERTNGHQRTCDATTASNNIAVKALTSCSSCSDLVSKEVNRATNQIADILQAVGAVAFHSKGQDGLNLQEVTDIKAQQATEKRWNKFEVVFIGTGAAIPSKYRNVSSTLVNISENNSVLLDCGEGTYGQLYRHYGWTGLNLLLRRLSCVFISHIHGDHHLGLIQILRQRGEVKNFQGQPLIVIGPRKIQMWLQEYNSFCENIDFRFIDSAGLVTDRHCDNSQQDFLRDLEAKQVETVPVIHCPDAYGLVVMHTSGWKLVYSGDTRPCPRLIDAGTGADLLIHEATLEDDLQQEALEKMHSTTTEAIESGLKMGAKFIMLNHFSQRYPKIPVFSEQFTQNIGIAFDHMKVDSSNFSKIPQIIEQLKIVFAEEIDEIGSKEYFSR